MTDDQIIEELQRRAVGLPATAVADTLDTLTGGGLSQGAMVTYFKRAFPKIPLRVLLEAGAWSRLSAGQLTDEEFDALLSPWLPGHNSDS
jgi:hypothetical protein